MSFRSLKVEGDVQKPRRLEIRLGCQGGLVGGDKRQSRIFWAVLPAVPTPEAEAVSEMSLIVKF